MLELDTVTFPPLVNIPIPLSPTVIFFVLVASNPNIPIPNLPTVIVPAFTNGVLPTAVASVYIPIVGFDSEVATPERLIVPEFFNVYALLLAEGFPYIAILAPPVPA